MAKAGNGVRNFRHLPAETATMIRADAGFYLFIAIYTLAGLVFLHAVGAGDRAAYWIYVLRWISLFALFLPAMTVIFDYGLILHRFDRKRSLAARKVFSPSRMARFLSGISLLMAMVAFQGTFTSVKNGLPVWQGGFRFDKVQADIDAYLHFGTDPWRWLFAMAENDLVRFAVEWNYNILWFAICFSALFFVVTSPKAVSFRSRSLISFMLVWIIVGNILAGLFLSAGPAFYGAVTGDKARFAEQLAFLSGSISSSNSAASYQDYLWMLHSAGKTGFGSGISAFPSVHVALITLNALFVWEHSRRLGIAAFAYVGLVIASSVYLAWHYAVDGYVAVAVTLAIYVVVRKAVPAGKAYSARPYAARPLANGPTRPEPALTVS